jgi:hypothetical protein
MAEQKLFDGGVAAATTAGGGNATGATGVTVEVNRRVLYAIRNFWLDSSGDGCETYQSCNAHNIFVTLGDKR